MTYMMNISFLTKEELEDAVMTWLNDEFIPVVTDPAIGFEKFEVFKLLTPVEEGHLTICLQIRSTNRKYIQSWFDKAAFPMCHELYKKYEDAKGDSDVLIFPSLMEGIG